MTQFSLISEYAKIIKEIPKQKSNMVSYQEYIIEVESIEQKVYIPIRESVNFENAIANIDKIDEDHIKILMRKFRGLRNKDE